MPRFAFPLPGRSKKHVAPPAAAHPQQVSKAHKVLGSTYISIDASPTSRDGSTSQPILSSTAPTSHGFGAATDRNRAGRAAADYEPRDWDDESGVLPRRIRIDQPSDDDLDDLEGDDSDRSRVLRAHPSSSTIKSWYDKSKQPLSVSQQTSASAMAKGLPPKAQRLLDVENIQAASVKSRKKPSRLDLSRLTGESRPVATGGWEGPMLGTGYVTHSPAAVTPKTPSSIGARYRQKLQKQPTKENLRRQQQQQQGQHNEVASASSQQTSPTSADRVSPRRPPNMTELPSLYKHYEQTSFQMIMDQDLAAAAGEEQNHEPLLEQPVEDSSNSADYRRRDLPSDYHHHHQQHRHNHHQMRPQRTPQTPDDELPSPLASHPTTPIQAPSPPRPQVVHVPSSLANKQEQQQLSPTDCSASISSRHTRTSKASKRTEKSFQTADFIDKSVLMLSSDSEDDDDGRVYTELSVPAAKRPTAATSSSISSRPTSELLDGISIHSGNRSVSSGALSRAEDAPTNRQSNRTVRRTSTAPAGHLAIPSRISTASTQATTPSTIDSNVSPNWGGTSTLQSSSTTPSIMSVASGASSSSTGMAANGRKGGGGGREGCAWASDWESNQHDTLVRQSAALIPPHDLASPPATVEDFPPVPGRDMIDLFVEARGRNGSNGSYRPPSGEEASSALSDGHLMGLTRQEQNLITALRQRRESMRKAGGGGGGGRSSSRGSNGHGRQPVRGHQSQESEATITEESLNFSFPVPPKTKGHVPRRSSSAFPTMITIPASPRNGTSSKSAGTDSTVFVLSPPPSAHHQVARHPSTSSRRYSSGRRGARMSEHEQMLLYLDHPGGPALAIKEGMMSPDTETFGIEGQSGFSWSRDSLSPPQSQRQRSLRRQRSNIETTILLPRAYSPIRGRQGSAASSAVILEDSEPPFPPPTRELPAPPTPQSRTPEPVNDEDEGVPRPDSPISMNFPSVSTVPEKRRTQMARLSAFGPPNPNAPVAWLGDA